MTQNHNLKDQFLLSPDVVFLNHGSFGACPKPVFETYQHWQLELERQPVEFIGRRVDGLLTAAREVLAQYLNADADNLIFVTNATAGVNLVARSLRLQPGDEILATDREYGALDYTWQFVCEKTGARYVQHPVPVRPQSQAEFVDAFWANVTPRTKVIFISHITSPTATTLPIKEVCRRARQQGIMTVVDGAHAPGQVLIDLKELDADFYSGNCHKWLCAPKGSAFLYAQPQHHSYLEPLVISWGYVPGSSFVQRNQQQGTRDTASFLSVPAAIAFQQQHDWDAVRARCHELARETRLRVAELTGVPPLLPDSEAWFTQMMCAPVPNCDPVALQTRLREEFHIEIPVIHWRGMVGVRASYQAYNSPNDMETLLDALSVLLPQMAVSG
jgi:isopenicillin-N epimerase